MGGIRFCRNGSNGGRPGLRAPQSVSGTARAYAARGLGAGKDVGRFRPRDPLAESCLSEDRPRPTWMINRRRERAEPARGLMRKPRVAVKKARRVEVAGAGQVEDQITARAYADGLPPDGSDPSSHCRRQAVPSRQVTQFEIDGCRRALVRCEDDVERPASHQLDEIVAKAVDEKNGERDGDVRFEPWASWSDAKACFAAGGSQR